MKYRTFTLPALITLCGLQLASAQLNYEPYSFSTFAGLALADGSADGDRTTARFVSPSGVAVDGDGNLYIAATGNHTIRKISGGQVSTLAGTAGSLGSANGTGSVARFFDPTGVAVDFAFNVYVADSGNNTIRKITPAGVVTTLAGTAGAAGSANGGGAAARFSGPQSVAVDIERNVYVADTFNHTIRKINSAGNVTTLAGSPGLPGSQDGTGSAARFSLPRGIAVDSSFNLYVADTSNSTIRKVTSAGVVTTLAGSAGLIGAVDGSGPAAGFSTPFGVAVNSAGTVFVADTDNELIRKVTESGVVTTLGGQAATAGATDGLGSAARFDCPRGVAVDGIGRLYVGDTGNCTIRLGQDPATAILGNISTRLFVQSGDNVLIAGFIITGSAPKKVLVRGLGPSLPVPSAMPNPRIELHQGAPTIAENDDWQTAANSGDIPLGFRPSDSRESAIFITLQPGAYTVVMLAGGSAANGVGLVEVYDFDNVGAAAELKNVATRGFVQTGDNVLIGGFITTGGNGFTPVVVRAIGPSLLPGIPNALTNPTLELRDGNGTLVQANDNWEDSQQDAIQSSGVAPSNELESALFAKLPAGLYTAIVAGSNGTSGVGVVEIYNVE